MSAEILRRAASLMREEASASNMIAIIKRRAVCGATVHHGPGGPHHRDPAHPKWCNAQPAGATRPAPSDYERTKAVALAMADWLDECAQILEEEPDRTRDDEDRAFAVARAHLGESA